MDNKTFSIGDNLINKETKTFARIVGENKFNKTFIIYDNSDKRNHEIPKDWAYNAFDKETK